MASEETDDDSDILPIPCPECEKLFLEQQAMANHRAQAHDVAGAYE